MVLKSTCVYVNSCNSLTVWFSMHTNTQFTYSFYSGTVVLFSPLLLQTVFVAWCPRVHLQDESGHSV